MRCVSSLRLFSSRSARSRADGVRPYSANPSTFDAITIMSTAASLFHHTLCHFPSFIHEDVAVPLSRPTPSRLRAPFDSDRSSRADAALLTSFSLFARRCQLADAPRCAKNSLSVAKRRRHNSDDAADADGAFFVCRRHARAPSPRDVAENTGASR